MSAHGHATPGNKRVTILISILAARAKAAEGRRGRAMGAYHHFEFATALFQIAIVLASAATVTGVAPLIFVAIGVSIVGTGLGALGWLAPTMLHL